MPLSLQLPDPPIAAFQEEIAAQVVVSREPGEAATLYPWPLWSAGALVLTMRHDDGTVEDLSPRDSGSRPQPVLVERSREPQVALEVRLPPPRKAGRWTAQLELHVGGKRLVAPPAQLTVLPPIALAVAAVASADRVVQLSSDGILLVHRAIRHEGHTQLTPGTRLDRLEAASVLPAEAIPDVDPDPLWVVAIKGDTAIARSYGDDRVESPPIALVAQGRPIWLGPPFVVNDERLLELAWASGNTVRIATVAADGVVSGPVVIALPGPVRRGAAIADRSGVTWFVQVDALPAKPAVKAGSLTDKQPPAQETVFAVHRGEEPKLFAAVPGTTIALTACPGALWGVEQSAKKLISTFRIPVGPGKPERHLGHQAFSMRPIALWCRPDLLKLVFLDGNTPLVLDTRGGQLPVPLKPPAPDFLGFVGGKLVAHDSERGLYVAD